MNLTVTALKKEAKSRGMSGYSRLRKPELMDLLGYGAESEDVTEITDDTVAIYSNVWEMISHSIIKRYYFPDTKPLEKQTDKTVIMDAYFPRWLHLQYVHEDNITKSDKDFLDIVASPINKNITRLSYLTRLMTECDRLDLCTILSPTIKDKVNMFYSILDKHNIDFAIVGAGGGGANAYEVFNLTSFSPRIIDYDLYAIYNLPRIPLQEYDSFYPKKVHMYLNGIFSKFDPNTTRRTLIYSGVDFHDRDIVRLNPNVISIDAGFTDDRHMIHLNPENVGIFASDTYGLINLHTMMINAYKGVEIFLDWFLSIPDTEIDSLFTRSEEIADYSCLEDESLPLYNEPVQKTMFNPTITGKGNKYNPYVLHSTIKNTVEEFVDSLQIPESPEWSKYIPMFPVAMDHHKAVDDSHYGCTRFLNKNNIITEEAECTLKEILGNANIMADTAPNNFLGIILRYTDDIRVNILHPMTIVKMKHEGFDVDKVYKWYIYSTKTPIPTIDPESDINIRPTIDHIIDAISEAPKTKTSLKTLVDFDVNTGDIITVAPKHNNYCQGIDIYSIGDVEQVPYYGYMAGDMSHIYFFTGNATGNISMDGETFCTGDSDSSLFSSRYRHSKVNPTSTFWDSYGSKYMRQEYQQSIAYGLDLWQYYLDQGVFNV